MKTRIKKLWDYFTYINKEVLNCQVFTGRGKF
jgi:hypothetical protein